jgi:hypothetical protein
MNDRKKANQSDMLTIGDRLPDFDLQATVGIERGTGERGAD